MAILIGIAFAIVVLIIWLAGSQVGRVLALAPLAGILGILIGGLAPLPAGQPYNWPAFWIGVALAWPVSGIPRYWQFWNERQFARRMERQLARRMASTRCP